MYPFMNPAVYFVIALFAAVLITTWSTNSLTQNRVWARTSPAKRVLHVLPGSIALAAIWPLALPLVALFLWNTKPVQPKLWSKQ